MSVLGGVAHELGFDPGKPSELLGLTAVGITHLAWRQSPVEDWGSLRYNLIDDGEMMRANAAATRLVRGVLGTHLRPVGLQSAWTALGGADGWKAVHDAIADPNRRLPDGRTLAEVAPDPEQFALFDEHVRVYCDTWASRAGEVGLSTVLIVLACHAATFARRWWLSVGWPHVVEEFIRRVESPDRWRRDRVFREQARLLAARGDPAATSRLRDRLLAGPDRLSRDEAMHCLRAGLGNLDWGHCGFTPAPRHVRRAVYFRLVDYPGLVPPPWSLR